jgi:hypothetical protein
MSDVVSDLCSKGNAKFADENFDEALQVNLIGLHILFVSLLTQFL